MLNKYHIKPKIFTTFVPQRNENSLTAHAEIGEEKIGRGEISTSHQHQPQPNLLLHEEYNYEAILESARV